MKCLGRGFSLAASWGRVTPKQPKHDVPSSSQLQRPGPSHCSACASTSTDRAWPAAIV